MYINAHQVPHGKSLYTAYVTFRGEHGEWTGEVEEVDFIAESGLTGFAAQTAAYDSDEFRGAYTAEAQGGNAAVFMVHDVTDGETVHNYAGDYGVNLR